MDDELPPGKNRLCVDDHAGESYLAILRRMHEALNPRTYLEIGCDTGESLALAKCASIGVDPRHRIKAEAALGTKPICAIYRTTSDDFFERHDPAAVLGGPIDFAFLDGLHFCEYLLRDFANTERHSQRNSVIALHDCLPVEWPMAEREHTRKPVRPHHIHSWAGDVWRTALLIKRRRPDLEITAYAAPPTGLVFITNLNPASTTLMDDYHGCVRQMMGMTLQDFGISSLFEELGVEPTSVLRDRGGISTRFWL
ncbi:MAG: class I SAM-dependent methyltransferase [Acetobacteraceae bacterium]